MEEEILTNEEFNALLEATALEAIQDFNISYGTDKELNEETLDYLVAFGIVSLFGYKALLGRTDIREDIKKRVLSKFDKSYQGIRETTKKELENLTRKLGRRPTLEELTAFKRKRMQEITDGVFFSTRNELEFLLAEEEGLNIVGAVTVGDDRVRDEHKNNNNKYWRASTYQPWADYNCRCTYIFFKNRSEARKNGFTSLQ